MARVRLLDPGFFTNEHLVELPFEYRLLFAGLWTLADREGRLEDRPKRIRMAIFPCDNVDCDAGLQALHDAGMVKRYSVEGIAYVAILAFSKHQKPHPRETSSVIPAPQGEPKARPRQTKGAPEDDQGSAKARGLSDSRTLGLSEQEQERAPDVAPARRATQIPDGFPAELEFAWCRTERPELDVLRTAQVFRDHHLARGSTMKSWPAAWRTWVGKERAPLPMARASPQGPPTAADARRAFVASITGHRAATQPDPRTIDVEPVQPEPPRIAAGCG